MRDPVLAGMVATGAELGLPVTLLSRGSTIEGRLVTAERWFDLLAEALEAPGTPGATHVAGIFREVRMAIELEGVARGVAGIGRQTDRVHLVDAVVRSGGAVLAVGLWRLEIDAVEGWKLGLAVPAPAAVDG